MKIDLSTLFEMIEMEDKNLSKTSAPVKQEKQKKTALDLQGLFSLFEQLEPSLNEMAKERERIDISWDGIPEIPISEIAFGGKGQDIISQEKKERLQVFLQNITGDSFEQKLQKLSQFLSGDLIDENVSIEKTLSYLVLLKVFTSNLTDFNQKSAGTNFEAIFAILMGGQQISGGSADFSDTADAMVDGERYSLKLTTSTTVGNKKHILIKTLADQSNHKHEVNYIIAHKIPVEGGVSVTFYKYPINLNNVFPLLTNNIERMRLLSQDQQVSINAPTEQTTILNIQKVAQENDFIKSFIESGRIKSASNNIDLLKGVIDNDRMAKELKIPQIAIYLYQFKSPQQKFNTQGMAWSKPEIWLNLYNVRKNNLSQEEFKKLVTAEEEAVRFAERYEQVSQNIDKTLQERTAESAEFITADQFKTMNDEQKLEYLHKSIYIKDSDNFKISTSNATMIARIEFGPRSIENVYQNYKQKLDDSIFKIFRELKIMSLNLESFFAGGMKDLDQAQRAQQASNNINQMTEKFKQQTVEPKE